MLLFRNHRQGNYPTKFRVNYLFHSAIVFIAVFFSLQAKGRSTKNDCTDPNLGDDIWSQHFEFDVTGQGMPPEAIAENTISIELIEASEPEQSCGLTPKCDLPGGAVRISFDPPNDPDTPIADLGYRIRGFNGISGGGVFNSFENDSGEIYLDLIAAESQSLVFEVALDRITSETSITLSAVDPDGNFGPQTKKFFLEPLVEQQ